MTKNEFLQGLNAELEGRVPHSVIQENMRYYDEYITQETAKGDAEEAVIETLGGPKIIARTIVDAAYDTEDRPDGYDGYGSAVENSKKANGSSGSAFTGGSRTERNDAFEDRRHIHYLDFNKWYVRLGAGLVVFFVIFLLMSIFFGIVGLAGFVLAHIWPVLVILMIIWMFRGPRR